MPEVTRVSRSYRERDDNSSDDDRSTYSRSRHGGESYRTVQRYRVTPSRTDDWDDRRSSHHNVSSRGERLEVDTRRTERFVEPERPRSAIDVRPRSTIVERYVERDPIREPERERTRTVVYERDSDRDFDRRPWDRGSNRPWESEQNIRETDVRIEKRTSERREEPRRDDYEVERYSRETEYYDRPEPPPQPIVIRQRAPEPQQIIVQEAPPPPPIILPRPEPNYEIIRREEVKQEIARPEPRREEDEYYYRRDVREVGPRDSRRDEDFAMARYDRREIRPRDSISDGGYSDDEDYVRTKRIIRTRSRSSSSHHKRHLAEGALAGAGAAALLASHRAKSGEPVDHRGRNVVGGAALGAIGAEVITRARSRYRENRDDRDRSRSSSRHSHSKVKTGLGLAAAAIATAAVVKYAQNRKANKDELGRGRSRNRSRSRRRHDSRGSYSSYSSSDRARSRSKHRDPKHRAASIAKAGAATAAVAGVVEHFRNKSRKRDGSRSKSRIRTGAEIVGSGLAGAAVAGLYENRKAKEEEKLEEEDYHRRERRRSRSRARSIGTYDDPGVDPELGMVQYGTEPVSVHQQTTTTYYDPALEAGRAVNGRSRSHRRRHSDGSDRHSRSRSRSKVRDIAGAAAATGAAAIGISEYRKRKEKKELQRERERRRYEEEPPPESYYDRDYDDGYSPSPPHASGGSYYPEQQGYPPAPQAVPPVQPGFMQHPNVSAPNVPQPPIAPYNPQDYDPLSVNNPYGYPPDINVSANENLPRHMSSPVPGNPVTFVPPPTNGSNGTTTSMPYFPPPPTSPFPENARDPLDRDRAEEAAQIIPPRSPSPLTSVPERPHNKSVMFAPMSPTSSKRLAKIHREAEENPDTMHLHDSGHSQSHHISTSESPSDHDSVEADQQASYEYQDRSSGDKRRRRSRRNSDPSSDRPSQPSKHRRRHNSRSRSRSPASDNEVEILPDRFDGDGRPLDRYGNRFGRSRGGPLSPERGGGGGQSEMVERIVRDVGDVVDGKKTWKDLLRGFVDDAAVGGGGSGSGSDSGGSRDRRRRKRRG